MDSTSPTASVQAPVPTWREIPLTKGLVAIVDAEDFTRVAVFKWHAAVRGKYAARRDCDNRLIYLHRFILDAQRGIEVDHKDGNGLDCRRANLRLATRAQNACNYQHHWCSSKSSRFRGVVLDKRCGRWRVELRVGPGLRRNLGGFDSEEAAARCYDRAAIQYHGEYATLNFPRSDYT